MILAQIGNHDVHVVGGEGARHAEAHAAAASRDERNFACDVLHRSTPAFCDLGKL